MVNLRLQGQFILTYSSSFCNPSFAQMTSSTPLSTNKMGLHYANITPLTPYTLTLPTPSDSLHPTGTTPYRTLHPRLDTHTLRLTDTPTPSDIHPDTPYTLRLPTPCDSLHPQTPYTLTLPTPSDSLHPDTPYTLRLPTP
ncbi:putative salivary glue protein Sgs-3-like [Homarus americanus]|uniref:Putative salivary glue protein Sgs-3-like n=1 Tax=Homarus americanus TaxID=6706 RepID=A0A8J5JV35_HOMAM|nr:putative salivary glue protein Sgs-3-like [Homarus americanus]